MHSQKTKQPYIRSDRKNRARKKSAVEVPRNRPVKNKKDEPFEHLERREQKKEATRRKRSHKKHEKGENDIKEEQVEKSLRTSPHKNVQK